MEAPAGSRAGQEGDAGSMLAPQEPHHHRHSGAEEQTEQPKKVISEVCELRYLREIGEQ